MFSNLVTSPEVPDLQVSRIFLEDHWLPVQEK